MSVLKNFCQLNQNLPDTSGCLSGQTPVTDITSANVIVLEALEGNEEKKKTSWGPYLSLTPTQKYEIGKQVAEHGVTALIQHFYKKYPDLLLKETTVQRLKEQLSELYKSTSFHPF